MFDLDRAIADWRRQMLAAGIKTPVPLEELEGHLRDDVDERIHSGVDAQQAFEAAVERLGQADPLTKEFAKDPFARGWKIGNLMLMVLAGIIFLYERWLLLDSNPSPIVRASGYFIIALTSCWIGSQAYLQRFLWLAFPRERIQMIGKKGMILSLVAWLAIPVATGWAYGFRGSVPPLTLLLCQACVWFFLYFNLMRVSAKKKSVPSAS